MDEKEEAFEELRSFVPESIPRYQRAILGKNVMESIWADMSRTRTPTWMSRAPKNWGTTQRGKLSADNWRVICTVHLPITLIRLWGEKTGRMKEVLAHFMDLVIAVRIANMRVTSPNHIQTYDTHIQRYTRKLKALYPDENIKPTHHAALHIGDMLHLFGPNHSHSGAHYERYINFFHRMNTNEKIGEHRIGHSFSCSVSHDDLITGQLEATLLKTSARSANLRALLSDNEDIRDSMQDLITTMDKINREDVRGFRLASILDPSLPTFEPRSNLDPQIIEDALHRLLCDLLDRSMDGAVMPKDANFMKEISYRGVVYALSTSSGFRDSSIMFREREHPQHTKAGIIENIFQYSYTREDGENIEDIFMAVEELTPITSFVDPYLQFGEFAGFLCEKQEGGNPRVIPMRQVVCHFAYTEMTDGWEGLIHVLPVDRVSDPGHKLLSNVPDRNYLVDARIFHLQWIR
jgi:hypothetical protein